MCCAFNKEAADKIFVDSKYTQLLIAFNKGEGALAFDTQNKTSESKFLFIWSTLIPLYPI